LKASRLLIAGLILALFLVSQVSSVSATVTLDDPIPDFNLTEDVVEEDLFNLNDHFSDGQSGLTFSAVSADNKIDIEIKNDGSVDLTPPKDWFGQEVLTFFASDGDQKVSDRILVTVEPVNDGPKQVLPIPELDPFLEDAKIHNAFNLNNHFIDIDNMLTFTHSSENILVEINDNGDVTLSAKANWFGSEEVEFTAFDGELSASDTITVSVISQNDEPECNARFEYINLKGDNPSRTLDMGGYFSDVEDEILTFEISGNEHVNFEMDSESGNLKIFAPEDWSGKEVITVTASDSQGATKSMQVVVVASPTSGSQGQVFYFTGLVLGLAIVGAKLQLAGRSKTLKSPVKLESYRHYKGQ
jgi:hypothetical protein